MREAPHALDIVVEPGPEPGPRPYQRLVGDLHDAVVAGEESGTDEALDELVVLGVGGEEAPRHLRPDGLPPFRRGHEPEHQVAQTPLLVDANIAVHRFGRPRHGAADAPGDPVGLDGERAPLPPGPGLPQRVRHQREGPRLPLDVADHQVDEPGFEEEGSAAGRALDGGAQLGLLQRAQEVEPALDESGEPGVCRQVPQPVGADGDHERPPFRLPRQGGEERLPFGDVGARGEHLFALVHDEHRRGSWPLHGGEDVGRMGAAGRHDDDAPSLPPQRSGEPGPYERGLARPRGAHDGQDPVPRQPLQAGGQLLLAAEVEVGVADVVREEARPRTGRAGLGHRVGRRQRAVLAQDRLLQGEELRSRIESQLTDEDGARLVDRPQGLALLPRLVLGQGEELPAALPGGGLLDASPGGGHHVSMETGTERGVDVLLLGPQAELRQALRLDPPGVPVLQLAERRAPPQGQCLVQHVRRPLRLPDGGELAAPLHQALETPGIDRLERHGEPIATPARLDGVLTEGPAEPHDAPLHDLVPGGGRLVTPERLGEAVGTDLLARTHGERLEHHPVPRPERALERLHPERAQDRDLHGRECPAGPDTCQRR